MMQTNVFGHQIENLHEGLTVFNDGLGHFIPLKSTTVSVKIISGLATIKTTRVFENKEDVPIEAVLTMPVGFDSVVTGLNAIIDGRKLIAKAKTQNAARDVYEDAINDGKLSVLHEEVLKGVHTLSIAQLGPGKEVEVELEIVTALGSISGEPFLRIPTTVGQIYGASPFLPADDLITTAKKEFSAQLSISCGNGYAVLNDGQIIRDDEIHEVNLNRSIEISVKGGKFGSIEGCSASGQTVTVDLKPVFSTDAALDVAILVDRSGSTSSEVGNLGATVWSAMRDGLLSALSIARRSDAISVWQFDNTCEKLGSTRGTNVRNIIRNLGLPNGGTELANAVQAVIADGATDILVLTDGQTWEHEVDQLKSMDVRISAVLVGSASLDANIGHLCSMTGGQVFYAPGDDVTQAISSSLTSLRSAKGAVKADFVGGELSQVTLKRSGVEITAHWQKDFSDTSADAIGRYAASLALPLLEKHNAQDFAEAHNLCSHTTSLVLVDDVGQPTEMLPEMRKVPLSVSPSPIAYSMSEPSYDEVYCADIAGEENSSYAEINKMDPWRHVSQKLPDTASTSNEENPNSTLSKIRSAIAKSLGLGQSNESDTTQLAQSAVLKASSTTDIRDPLSVARAIDWDQYSNRFLTNQISDLSGEQQRLVRGIAASVIVLEISRDINEPRTVVALALLAKLVEDEDRAARRFAKKILDIVEIQKIEDAIAVCELV